MGGEGGRGGYVCGGRKGGDMHIITGLALLMMCMGRTHPPNPCLQIVYVVLFHLLPTLQYLFLGEEGCISLVVHVYNE